MNTRIKFRKHAAQPEAGKVDVMSIGRRIRQLRGFDTQQADFARILGVTQSQLSKYERGITTPPLEVLAILSERFGKSLDWLVLGREEK